MLQVSGYNGTSYTPYQSSTSSLSELIATLATSHAGWSDKYLLTTPVPSPESLIGSGADSTVLEPLLAAYNKERTKVSVPLVLTVMADVDAYDKAAKEAIEEAGQAVVERLKAAASKDASASMQFTEEEIAAKTHDPHAPDSTSLAYVPYAQRVAATVSMGVSLLICTMITAVNVG